MKKSVPKNPLSLKQCNLFPQKKKKVSFPYPILQNPKARKNSKRNGKICKQLKKNQQVGNQKKLETDCLKIPFQKTVGKVFELLDIFSRGFISEVNINQWVPEEAFYFLGGVFQKIKQSRKNFTKQEFQSECRKLFQISTKDDISEFIENMSKIEETQNEKFSQEGDDYRQFQQSHVQDRFSLQNEGNTSFRKNIKEKNVKIISFSKPLEEEEIKESYSFALKGHKNPAPLTEINNFSKINIGLGQLGKNSHKQSKKLENWASMQSNKKEELLNSPIFKKKEENDRIDKLSSKLQSFIKENSLRLEISKNIRIDT